MVAQCVAKKLSACPLSVFSTEFAIEQSKAGTDADGLGLGRLCFAYFLTDLYFISRIKTVEPADLGNFQNKSMDEWMCCSQIFISSLICVRSYMTGRA